MSSLNDKIANLAFDPSAPEGEAIAAFLKLRARKVTAKDVANHTKEDAPKSGETLTVKVPDVKVREFLKAMGYYDPQAVCTVKSGNISDDKKINFTLTGATRAQVKKAVDSINPVTKSGYSKYGYGKDFSFDPDFWKMYKDMMGDKGFKWDDDYDGYDWEKTNHKSPL